ncbi:MAG: anthranilate phosphoribosyltransferase [bacterium]
MDLPSILQKLAQREDLSATETSGLILVMMSGELDQAQTAAILMGLRCKGETAEEIAGAARAMREKAVRITSRHNRIVDTCGTGGDHSGTFNISTVTAFVVAGADVVVAKHCNRSASSRCGSADLFEGMGLCLEASPDQVTQSLDKTGFTVLFARAMHPAMKFVAPVRSSLGIRTIFNFLGPLTNPAGATHQLVGISDEKYLRLYAQVLADLGAECALVVHGNDGLDELTLVGETKAVQWDGSELRELTLTPEDAGLSRCSREDLLGGDLEENVAIATAILQNRDTGPKRDTVLLNAGAVLWTAGAASDLRSGVEQAVGSLNSGRAWEKVQQVREILGHPPAS